MSLDTNSRLVYSTGDNNNCPACGKKLNKCKCRNKEPKPVKNDGVVRLCRQTKGRKGKGVTLITGIDKPEDELKVFAKELKKKCGSGGTLKNGIIEIQGDHRDVLLNELKKAGFAVKLSGG